MPRSQAAAAWLVAGGLALALALAAAVDVRAERSAYDHFEQGMREYDRGAYRDAAESFRQAARKDPDVEGYVDWLGKVLVDRHEQVGGLDHAIEVLSALAAGRSSWVARYWRARAYFLEDDEDSLREAKDLLEGIEGRADDARRQTVADMLADIEGRLARTRDQETSPLSGGNEPAPGGNLLVLVVVVFLAILAVVVLRRLVFVDRAEGRSQAMGWVRDLILLVVFGYILAVGAAFTVGLDPELTRFLTFGIETVAGKGP